MPLALLVQIQLISHTDLMATAAIHGGLIARAGKDHLPYGHHHHRCSLMNLLLTIVIKETIPLKRNAIEQNEEANIRIPRKTMSLLFVSAMLLA